MPKAKRGPAPEQNYPPLLTDILKSWNPVNSEYERWLDSELWSLSDVLAILHGEDPAISYLVESAKKDPPLKWLRLDELAEPYATTGRKIKHAIKVGTLNRQELGDMDYLIPREVVEWAKTNELLPSKFEEAFRSYIERKSRLRTEEAEMRITARNANSASSIEPYFDLLNHALENLQPERAKRLPLSQLFALRATLQSVINELVKVEGKGATETVKSILPLAGEIESRLTFHKGPIKGRSIETYPEDWDRLDDNEARARLAKEAETLHSLFGKRIPEAMEQLDAEAHGGEIGGVPARSPAIAIPTIGNSKIQVTSKANNGTRTPQKKNKSWSPLDKKQIELGRKVWARREASKGELWIDTARKLRGEAEILLSDGKRGRPRDSYTDKEIAVMLKRLYEAIRGRVRRRCPKPK